MARTALNHLLQHSNYERAAELLRQAVSIERLSRPANHPRLDDRLFALGDCMRRLGNTDQAKAFINEAIEI